MKKGQHMTEAMKENLRKHRTGKKLSPEHRAKVIRTLRLGRKGEDNPGWKGGRIMNDEGYCLLRLPNHPNARSNGYYPEHRLVMEQKLGRILLREEVVHHINGIRTDNRPENLELKTHSEHAHHHWDDSGMKKAQSEFVKKVRRQKFWSTRPKKVRLTNA